MGQRLSAENMALDAQESDENELLGEHDQHIVQLLKKQQIADDKGNKQLIQRQVSKNLAGKRGQNCW